MSDNIDISSDLLFPVVEVLSPRLAWMTKHNLETEHLSCGGIESPETGDVIPHWICRVRQPRFVGLYSNTEIASGDTEQEAIANLAIKRRLKLWNEEAP